jgi:hypothetical protein
VIDLSGGREEHGMTREEKIKWLRRSYWVGAVADGLSLVPMLSPKAGGSMFGIEDFNPPVEYKYAMGMGASLMAGWTALLIWADRKPIERKGILPLTVFPVIFGIALSGALTMVRSGQVQTKRIIPLFMNQAAIAALFAYSYYSARDLDEEPC